MYSNKVWYKKYIYFYKEYKPYSYLKSKYKAQVPRRHIIDAI